MAKHVLSGNYPLTVGTTQIDTRIGGAFRYYLSPQEDMNMRVPDEVLKSSVFIGAMQGTEPVYGGTGYFVGVDGAYGSPSWIYLVTARHVAEKIDGLDFVVRVNRKDGPPAIINGVGTKWWYHPTEPDMVDSAVVPWGLPDGVGPTLDVATLPLAMFATDKVLAQQNIGIGDQVFVVGLFTRVQKTSRSIPICRIGNIAMVPGEPIYFGNKLIEAYLIESRSIGGLSGSPVFVRNTVNLQGLKDGSGQPLSAAITSNTFYFLGSVIGHWDQPGPQDVISQVEAVNMGIAPIVPAQKIVETINHPELVEMRKQWDEKVRASNKDHAVLDDEIPNKEPFTREDFESSLKKASRKIIPKQNK
ncbi:MAG: hypothetical protein WB952_02050 [Terriglobales bacterium]